MTDTSRETLIKSLRDLVETLTYSDADTAREAAAMLEADVSLINEGNKAQQVAVPLTDKQAHEALSAAGISTFFMTAAITRKERWLTEGSTNVMPIIRAIEAAHGITPPQGDTQ